jgi:hypothetical protein
VENPQKSCGKLCGKSVYNDQAIVESLPRYKYGVERPDFFPQVLHRPYPQQKIENQGSGDFFHSFHTPYYYEFK